MAASIPSQERTVDPFASYNSNTVNHHTKMITLDNDVIANISSLRVTDAMDATSTAVFVSTGIAYKDAVLIQMTAQGTVDFNTADHYYDWDSPGLGFDENGYYYIILNYVYVKSRPAPQASYQILKPSQRGSFSTGGSWLFLAAVLISGVGVSGAQIDEISDYDPDNPDNKRLYPKTYAGTETFLPTHNQTRDQARIAYDSTSDEFYFGYSDRWGIINANVYQTTINVSDWISSGGSYYADVTHSLGTQYNTITVVSGNGSDINMKIEPQDIEFFSTNVTKIWMPDNTHTLHVAIAG